jgi:ABC-2 type transport system permease protein
MTKKLTVTEFRLFAREPIALFWGVAFPIVILIVVGSSSSSKHSHQYGGLRFIDVYVPVLMVFVLSILALNALPAVLTSYRDSGYLRRLATTPVGAPRVIGVQLGLNFGVSAVAMAVILIVARLAFGVAFPVEFVGFLLTLALAAVAMLGLGGVIAALAPSVRVAGLLGSLLFFPMMFFAGLWGPQASMSAGLRHASEFTPLGATVAGIGDAMHSQFPAIAHLAVLVGYAVVFVFAASRLFRWDK